MNEYAGPFKTIYYMLLYGMFPYNFSNKYFIQFNPKDIFKNEDIPM